MDSLMILTILAFLFSTGISLAYSICNLYFGDLDIMEMHVPYKVAKFVMIITLYKFAYELREVRLKIQSDSYLDYKRRLKHQKIIWKLIYIAMIVALTLELISFYDAESTNISYEIIHITAHLINLITD